MTKHTITSRIVAVFASIALLFTSSVSFAEGQVVKEIDFSGNNRTPSETLKSKLTMKREMRLNEELVDLDVKSLFSLGQFQDVTAETQDVPGGVKLTYLVVEKPLISKISFEGNKKLKEDDLLESVIQKTYSVLDDKAVAESIDKMREAYAKKGFYLAQISYRVDVGTGDEATLVFEINENKGVAVRRIMFIGNKVFNDEQLRDVVRTRQKGAMSFLTGSGKYDEELLKADAMMLAYHYLNNGYLKVKVSPAKVNISKDKRYIFITFQITEGSQYKIGDVTIEGDILTTHEELASQLKTKSGQIYSQKLLDEDTQNLIDRYGDEGYAFANVVPQTIPDDEALTADINIGISKGKRISIERINIYGNTHTRDKVIRREMEIMENDRYSERLLRKSREKLMRLGYFEEVNFATPRGSRDDTVVLNISVKEKSTRSFNIGAGFSSAEKFIFNASVNLENGFGYGISTALSAEISKIRQMFMLSMSDPYFLDTEWMAGFSAYRSSYVYTDFTRQALGGDVNIGHRFFDNCAASIGYQLEQVKVSSYAMTVPEVFKQSSSGRTSALSLSLSRDTRNNRLAATKGLFHSVVQEVSGNKLGGSNDFYRVNFRQMLYQPIYKSLVFKQFFRLGYIKSLNDKPVPLFERFFAGGVNSLRGYDPNSVGPTLRIPVTPDGSVQNFVYGGDKLMLLITELELPLYDKAGIRAVGFFDAGNAYSENENYSFNNLRLDYGFGLRWHSPFGPMRFEFGFPIERRPGEQSWIFNFSIGEFF